MGKVYFVGAGPGAPDLITVRGKELLSRADVLIYTGSLVSPALIEQSSAPFRMDSWKRSLEEIIPVMVQAVREGKTVVRLHSGDPSLYGAIVEQMRMLEAGECLDCHGRLADQPFIPDELRQAA